jgi:DNA-binding MarR family transcriptional regulator
MAHTIRLMPESEQTRAILEAERRHSEALEEAATQITRTLPRMFRNLKHQLRNSTIETPYKEMGEQQIGVLAALAHGNLLTSELAKKFDVATPTVTRTVDALVERGYVERQPDATDRRKIYLRLTQTGRDIGDFANAQFRAAMTGRLSRLTEGQLHDIALACRHLSTLFPEGLYEYEDACPVRPGVQRKE